MTEVFREFELVGVATVSQLLPDLNQASDNVDSWQQVLLWWSLEVSKGTVELGIGKQTEALLASLRIEYGLWTH